ncbi:hypothetical protein GCM10022222_75390 [Amycolatopsis ultiminotia]|uniref:Protein kinase domain-containing protein n=1 Tax=Amycolatopsis ultiminotia TaxID=543629 RepID=A0ABP6Y979_9PSEU
MPKTWRLFGRKRETAPERSAPPPVAPADTDAGRAEAAALLASTRAWLDLPPHPHLRSFHGLRLEDGHPRMVLEDAPGEDLATAAGSGRFTTVDAVLDAAVQLAWAVQALHDAGIAHGDLRATSAIRTSDGIVKLAELGALRPLGNGASDDVRALATVVAGLFSGPQRPLLPDPGSTPTAREFADRLVEIHRQTTGNPYFRAEPKPVEPPADEWNNRGLSLALAGDHAAAEQYWERALQADPRHPDATFNLGLHHWRTARITDDELLRRMAAVEQAAAPGDRDHIRLLAELVDRERGDTRTGQQRDDDPPLTARTDSGWLYSVAGTPDGGRVVWAAEDGVLRWWDSGRGGKVHKLTGHTDEIWSVAITPDGRYALSGSADTTARCWDLGTGRCVQILEGHQRCVRGVAISADGRYAVTGAEDGFLRHWDLRSGKLLRTVTQEKVCILSVSMTPDARYVAAAGNNSMARWWDLKTGTCLQTLTGHTDNVHSVAVTPDGRYALTGGNDRTVRWWDLRTGECLRTLTAHASPVWSVALSADGRQAATGSLDRTARCWDLGTGRCVRTIEHEYLVLAVDLTADGRRVASTATDRKVRVWDQAEPRVAPWQASPASNAGDLESREQQFRAQLSGARDLLANAAVPAATARLRAARAVHGYARHPEAQQLWREAGRYRQRTEFTDIRRVRTIEHPAGLTSLALSDDGRRAVAAGWDFVLRHWDLTTGECLAELPGHEDALTSLAFGADGTTAVSTSSDQTLRWWDLRTGQCLRILSGHADEVTAVALSADGHAMSASADHTLRWWNLHTGECLRILSGHTEPVNAVAITADGRQALSGSSDTTVRWWDIGTGECRKTLHSHSCASRVVALTPGAGTALSGETCGNLQRWQLPQAKYLGAETGHEGPMLALAVTADGAHALTAGADRTLRLRDLRSGRCLRVLTEHDDELCGAALALDAWSALTGSKDGTLIGWALDWNHESAG